MRHIFSGLSGSRLDLGEGLVNRALNILSGSRDLIDLALGALNARRDVPGHLVTGSADILNTLLRIVCRGE